MGTEDTTKKFDEIDRNRLPAAIVDLERRVAELEDRFKSQGYMTRPQHEEALRHVQAKSIEHHDRLADLEEKVGREQGVELVFRDYAYFTPSGDGPFCQKCYDDSSGKKRCRLRHIEIWEAGEYQCTVCTSMFYAPGARSRTGG